MIATYDAWALRRLMTGLADDRERQAISGPFRRVADHLAALPLEARPTALGGFLCSREDVDGISLALAETDPTGPAPAADRAAGPNYATLADIARVVAAQPWLWPQWLAAGVLNVVAADPGIGKSRFAFDLARRLWARLPWPDGQANQWPEGTRTLWVQGDRNFAEMVQAARDFGLPGEAVILNAPPDNPTEGLDLDDRATLDALAERITAAGPALVVIDTVGMTTGRNLCRPEEAREFFAPILELAAKLGVALLGLTHLSKDKEALGRRIVEKARVVLKLTQPDPEGQPHRRRLWVDKSAVVKPPPLGVTMGAAGNEYDFNPPAEPKPTAQKRGPAPERLDDCKQWLAGNLTPHPVRVVDVRKEVEKAGYSVGTLYAAKDALGVEEYTVDRRKWWSLPKGAQTEADPDADDPEELDADGSDQAA